MGGGLVMWQELRKGGGPTDCFIGIPRAHEDQEDQSSVGPTSSMHSFHNRWAQLLANGCVMRWTGMVGERGSRVL